ncbi:hypothetical protein KFU94_69155 [Chloroflexi bacterium TSY]|nr:hypothetical protein [Chloroflexi bacterium TSY]
MSFNHRIFKVLFVTTCLVCALILSSISTSLSVHAQSTCPSAITPGATVEELIAATEQQAWAIVVNGFEEDIIRYEYHLVIDAALASAIASATEACIVFQTTSEVWSLNSGEANYAASIKVGHKPAGMSTYQTFAHYIDERDTRNGDTGLVTVDYAESLNAAGIVVSAGDQLGVVVNGVGIADADTGSHFDQATVKWYIGSALAASKLVLN